MLRGGRWASFFDAEWLFDNSAKIAKTALKKGTTLKEEALKTKLINEKDFDRIVNPKKMIHPK